MRRLGRSMMRDIVIRPIEERDLPALLAIYNQYIATTPVTFDVDPKTLDDRKVWLKNFARTGRYRCFVAEQDGEPVGWACSMRLHDRAAYDPSVLVSVYLKPSEHRKGLGRR